MIRRSLPLLAGLLLLGCSQAPEESSLEARARAGEPRAACELVQDDLVRCAEERHAWVADRTRQAPSCLTQPARTEHVDYLVKARATIADPDRRQYADMVLASNEALTSLIFADFSSGGGTFYRSIFDQMLVDMEQACIAL